MLDSRLELAGSDGAGPDQDEWLDLAIGLRWSRARRQLWCFPIETVSQSEGGFEGVYQSSAVIPRWVITADRIGAMGGSDPLESRERFRLGARVNLVGRIRGTTHGRWSEGRFRGFHRLIVRS